MFWVKLLPESDSIPEISLPSRTPISYFLRQLTGQSTLLTGDASVPCTLSTGGYLLWFHSKYSQECCGLYYFLHPAVSGFVLFCFSKALRYIKLFETSMSFDVSTQSYEFSLELPQLCLVGLVSLLWREAYNSQLLASGAFFQISLLPVLLSILIANLVLNTLPSDAMQSGALWMGASVLEKASLKGEAAVTLKANLQWLTSASQGAWLAKFTPFLNCVMRWGPRVQSMSLWGRSRFELSGPCNGYIDSSFSERLPCDLFDYFGY